MTDRAVESGSRAWGFASSDSDYDVRFIYVRPRDWYLAIDVERQRDVIETPIEGLWDVNGWGSRREGGYPGFRYLGVQDFSGTSVAASVLAGSLTRECPNCCGN